jgi:hypothetical protein
LYFDGDEEVELQHVVPSRRGGSMRVKLGSLASYVHTYGAMHLSDMDFQSCSGW